MESGEGVLRVMIYHGGQFLGGPGQIYSGGMADDMGKLNVDFMSIWEFERAVKGLGYCSVGDLWYNFDDEDWIVVKKLRSDKDVFELMDVALKEKKKMLNIFVEHLVDSPEVMGNDAGEDDVGVEVMGNDAGEPSRRRRSSCRAPQIGKLIDESDEGEVSDYGTDVEDFSDAEIDEPDLFENVESPTQAAEDDGAKVDWFGAFPGPEAESNADDIASEYEASDGFNSEEFSDGDGAPNDEILPPIVRVQPGRPRKVRRREQDEPVVPYKLNRAGYLVTCGNCGTEGHNARKCPQPENPNKKVWKKKTKRNPTPGETEMNQQDDGPSNARGRGRGRGKGRGRGRGRASAPAPAPGPEQFRAEFVEAFLSQGAPNPTPASGTTSS